MSQEVQMPSEGERKAFIEKLGQFRSTLPESEQRMLDAMALAGLGGQEADVQGYGYIAYGPAPVPGFYFNYVQPTVVGTPYGLAYANVVRTGYQPYGGPPVFLA